MKINDKVVLITGGTRGIGLVTAELLRKKGMKVYTTTRDLSKLSSDFPNKEYVLQLDVVQDESVNACVDELIKKEGRIDVLINNAGYGVCGALTDTGMDQLKAIYETNVFGPHRMVLKVVPIMKEQGEGKIINIGSYGGRLSLPYQGLYSATKAALAMYSDALKMELSAEGIDVALIEPGDTSTDFHAGRQYTPHFDEDKTAQKAIETMHHDEENGIKPIKVAKKILRAIKAKNAKPRYPVGFQTVWVGAARHLFSKKAQQKLLKMYYGIPNKKKNKK